MPMSHTIEMLAALPPWPLARELAVPGRCRGALLRDWAAHVRRRAGDDAVTRLRTATGIDTALLPDAPKATEWYPIGYQIALTRAIVDHALGGDVLALEPLLADDTARAGDKILALALRTLGPKRLLKRTAKAHSWLYDVGHADAAVDDGAARIDFTGAIHFGDPTWRVLQLFAVRGMLAGFGREVTSLRADPSGDDRFAVEVRWR